MQQQVKGNSADKLRMPRICCLFSCWISSRSQHAELVCTITKWRTLKLTAPSSGEPRARSTILDRVTVGCAIVTHVLVPTTPYGEIWPI